MEHGCSYGMRMSPEHLQLSIRTTSKLDPPSHATKTPQTPKKNSTPRGNVPSTVTLSGLRTFHPAASIARLLTSQGPPDPASVGQGGSEKLLIWEEIGFV